MMGFNEREFVFGTEVPTDKQMEDFKKVTMRKAMEALINSKSAVVVIATEGSDHLLYHNVLTGEEFNIRLTRIAHTALKKSQDVFKAAEDAKRRLNENKGGK